MLFLSLLFVGSSWAATPKAPAPAPEPFVNAPSVEAERALKRMAGAESSTLKTDAERERWAKARLAWISLTRLQSRDEEAMRLFAGCADLCEKFGPKEEWEGAKAWACSVRPAQPACAKPALKVKAKK